MTKASVSNIKFYPDKEINKILTMKLSACDYVNDHLNVIVVGATGSGKMYYISALDQARNKDNYKKEIKRAITY